MKPSTMFHVKRPRKKHRDLPDDQRRKANARATANVSVRRGRLLRLACESCGALHAEKHHVDYSQPLNVRWLCRPCHLKEHAPATPPPCSVCRGPRDRPGQQFCKACHAAYMRKFRMKQRALVTLARTLIRQGKAVLPPEGDAPCSKA